MRLLVVFLLLLGGSISEVAVENLQSNGTESLAVPVVETDGHNHYNETVDDHDSSLHHNATDEAKVEYDKQPESYVNGSVLVAPNHIPLSGFNVPLAHPHEIDIGKAVGREDHLEHSDTLHEECELAVASFNWEGVQNPVVIAAFLFFSAMIKITFHHAGFLVTKIPESCLLIVLGTLVGTIFTFGSFETFPEELKTLSPELFFMVLLPPIVLEASYSLHNRVFFDNLFSILVFAVLGTILSCFIIGPTLYGLSSVGALGGEKIGFIHCMLFSSIIVAVDPVAVLAIFQEVGVNTVLYFLVFGESLLNDAVTVVLYHTVEGMNCFLEEGSEITPLMYIIAVCKFFATSLGGLFVGIIFGTITCLLTKYTVETRVVEPLLLFSLSYLSYVMSELFHFSGIVGLTACGLVQAQYAFHNISHKSYVTVKYFTKMASSASDSVIFLFLGLNLVRLDHVWHTGFIIASVLLTLIIRFVVIYSLSAMVNTKRLRQISGREMFIMMTILISTGFTMVLYAVPVQFGVLLFFCHIRGAVAFSLVSLLTGKLDQEIQRMFMTTTLVIIIFTVFVQGGTIKPLVSLLDIRRQNKEGQLMLFDELHSNITDHLMAGIEEIVGKHGQFFFYDWLMHMDDKYIKHKLQRNPMRKDEKIMKLYEKIALKQHFANLKGSEAAEKFHKQSVLALDGTLIRTGSQVSMQPQISVSRPTRASLLSQLTRYGTIEEPDHIDDIAYITPEMLEDEEETKRSQKRLKRQTTAVVESINDPKHLKHVLTKPGSHMEARALTSHIDMDDRSDLMHLLQEKNRRLERFKRSVSHIGADESQTYVAPSTMATIREARNSWACDRQFDYKSGGGIVKKPGIDKQGSILESRLQLGARSRRGIFAERPSALSQDRTGSLSVPPGPPGTVSPGPGPFAGSQGSFAPGYGGRIHKDTDKQTRLHDLHRVHSVKDTPEPTTTPSKKRVSKIPKDKNNSNLHVYSKLFKRKGKGKHDSNPHSDQECDSVFLAPEQVELEPRERKNTLDTVLGLLASKSEQDMAAMAHEDVEQGRMGEGKDQSDGGDRLDEPLAHSSQDPAMQFPSLDTVQEEHASREAIEDSPIEITATAAESPPVSESETDEGDSERIALVPREGKPPPDKTVNT